MTAEPRSSLLSADTHGESYKEPTLICLRVKLQSRFERMHRKLRSIHKMPPSRPAGRGALGSPPAATIFAAAANLRREGDRICGSDSGSQAAGCALGEQS